MKIKILFIVTALFIAVLSNAQKGKTDSKEEGYKFTPVVSLKATPVKNQASTGTCWCFATTSFIESELLRMGKPEYDLSEMWIVRYNYADRLRDNFVQKGKGNLGEGSVGHDWIVEFVKNGVVPDEVYTGLNYGMPNHSHGELNSFVNAIAAVPVKRNRESDQYLTIIDAVLDTYLGKAPESFTYNGVGYTPKSFTASLGIKVDDYVEITSFTLFPFYTQGVVPIPDNWRKMNYYNVPLDELIEVMDYSLSNGYTVAWDGDVSEKSFSHAKGVAINPEESIAEEALKFSRPYPEAIVTQESRQAGFDAKKTTDDHLMHLTGTVKDQKGTKYYVTKNSWGTGRNPFGGYLNMSESYVRAKTIAVMVHKNAIPPAIKTKLGIQ
jgi:bleomycin hydrolase